jgi:hypothetical protein
MTTLLIILISISLSSIAHADNSVFIEQITTSDDTTITVNQDGNNNAVNLTMAHDDNTLDIDQKGNNNTVSWISYWGSGRNWGGDLDGTNNTLKFEQINTTGSDSNKIGFHIQSNGNTVHVGQGCSFDNSSDTSCGSSSTVEYGGHTTNLDLHSGGNNIKISQETGTGNADHYVQLYTYGGENNNTFIKQKGNGNKTLNMTIRTDGGSQDILQKDDGAHTATIDLTGTYHTNMSLIQRGSTNQSYSLIQNCQTSGGCGVSVTQGN